MARKKSNFDKWYCVLLAIIGLIMSLSIPVWQTPDEYAHLKMIASSLDNDDIAKNIINDIEGYEYKNYFNDLHDIHSYTIILDDYVDLLQKKPSYTRGSMLPHGINISLFKHFPATIGILIGSLLGLPSLIVLHIGEVFSILFYILMIYASLQVLPIKKVLFCCFAISPMVMQQVASINYDAVLFPLCFFYIAKVLNFKFCKEQFGLKDILILLGLILYITYIKIPYFFLVLFLLVIPLEKYNIQLGFINIDKEWIEKNKIPLIFVGLLSFVSGIYLLRNHYYFRILLEMLHEWKRSLYLFKSTFQTWFRFLFISSVGNFGWLDTPISIVIAVIIYIVFVASAFCDNRNRKYTWRKKDYIIVFGTFLLLCCLITTSMVNHTMTVILFGEERVCDYNVREALYQIPYIGGLQGRYYIPFLMLPFFLLPSKLSLEINTRLKNVLIFVSLMLFCLLEGYIVFLLLNRYW